MALKKETVNNIGQKADYHRIVGAEINFDLQQLRIYIDSYSSEDYRNIEKKQIDELNSKVDEYYNLLDSLKEEKRVKKIDEINKKLSKLNIQELEATKIERLSLKRDVVTVDIKDDLRDMLYQELKNIPEFKDAEDV